MGKRRKGYGSAGRRVVPTHVGAEQAGAHGRPRRPAETDAALPVNQEVRCRDVVGAGEATELWDGRGRRVPAQETAGVRGDSVLQRERQGQHQHHTPGPEQSSANPQLQGAEGHGGRGWRAQVLEQHPYVSRCVTLEEKVWAPGPVSTSRTAPGISTALQEGEEGGEWPQRCLQRAWRTCGGSGRGPGSKQQGWHREEQGDWHVGWAAAGRSSARCCWGPGEAGLWRGTWLSCWRCTKAAGTHAR